MSYTTYITKANDHENQAIYENLLKVLDSDAMHTIHIESQQYTWYILQLTPIEYEKIVSYGIKLSLDDDVVGLCNTDDDDVSL